MLNARILLPEFEWSCASHSHEFGEGMKVWPIQLFLLSLGQNTCYLHVMNARSSFSGTCRGKTLLAAVLNNM